MTLNIPLDRAVRGLAAQAALINAVIGAPANEPETDYIEWKSIADVAQKDWRAECAKQILGFANRDPGQASTAFEGCAYLLLGVEPGNAAGTPVYDLADVEKWISTYAGADANSPLWRFDFVRSLQVDVGVLTIEPPKYGDPPFSFRKDYQPTGINVPPYQDGDIWVRKGARTEKARSADHQRLAARARSNPVSLSASVTARPTDVALAIDATSQAIDAWIQEERGRLLTDGRRASPIASMSHLDGRSRGEFEAEVEGYLVKAGPALGDETKRLVMSNGELATVLRVANPGPEPFRAVVLELTVTPPLEAYVYDEDLTADFPSRPTRWGTFLPAARMPHFPSVGSINRDATARKDDSGDTVIEFAPFELRPHSTKQLLELFVFAPVAHVGSAVTIPWRLTASGLRGDQRGTLELPVTQGSLGPSDAVRFTVGN